MVKKPAPSQPRPSVKKAAAAKRPATGAGLPLKAPGRQRIDPAGRGTAPGRRGHIEASSGHEFGPVESLRGRGPLPAAQPIPANLRATLEELAERAFARSPFAANEARLRSQVRHLQRQVSQQAREIQALKARNAAETMAESIDESETRAGRALDALRTRLADQLPLPAQAPEAARRRWVDEGVLVPTATLVEAWGVTRQALDQARERGDLVGLKVANRQYYPAAFLGFAANAVAQVCQALAGVDAVSAILFWTRQHGALDGLTLAEAVKAQGLGTVLQAAEAFADELSGVKAASEGTQARAHAA